MFTISDSNKKSMWSLNTDSGSGWYQGGFFVGQQSKVQVEIDVTKGTGAQGDMALDDVGFHRCFLGAPEECMADEFMCGSGHCIPASKLCDLVQVFLNKLQLKLPIYVP